MKPFLHAVKQLKWLLTTLLLVSLAACSEPEFPPDVTQYLQAWEGKQIQLPTQLDADLQTNSIHLASLTKAKAKIVIYLEADCSICYSQLTAWKEQGKDYQISDDVEIIYIAFGGTDEFIKYVLENKKTPNPYPIFFDKENTYYESNQLDEHGYYKTMLLDEHNQVVQVGSPIFSEPLAYYYKKSIKELLN